MDGWDDPAQACQAQILARGYQGKDNGPIKLDPRLTLMGH